ncbi:MAG: hypothetical protein J5J06_03270 [Phycisphaerae bacterium]|nr:hypothetical protein [Phycisphaerae bacterium]
MKYKTLFRLLLKIVGVALTVTGAQSLLTQLAWICQFWGGFGSSGASESAMQFLFILSGPVISLVCGLYLFFDGQRVADLAIPGDHPYCPECAYDLTGAVSTRCPECGTPFRWEDVMPGKCKMESAESTQSDAARDESNPPR